SKGDEFSFKSVHELVEVDALLRKLLVKLENLRRSSVAENGGRKILDLHRVFLAKNGNALDDVFELTDVARPSVAAKRLLHLARQGARRAIKANRFAREKVLGAELSVSSPLA